MALPLVGGAAIGALFGALYDVVKISIGRTVMQYKPLLADLKFTLDSLRPRIIQQIGEHNVELGISNEDIESLQRQMEEGIELVGKLSNLGTWSCYILCSYCNCEKPSYAEQLVELDRSLRTLLEILKLQEARDVKEVLLLARKINDKQDELERRLADLLKVQQESGDVGESSASSAETTPHEQTGGNGGQQVAPSGGGVGAAALGAAFGLLFDTIMQVEDKTTMLKRPLGDLKSTLDSLKPLIEEMAECSKVLNLPKGELENVRMQMENGAELVSNCAKVRQWTSYKTYEYTDKLHGLDESLQRLLTVLRVQLARDVRESLVSVSNMETVIKRIEGRDVVQNDDVVGKRWCPLPEPPSSTVGLDAQETCEVIKETMVAARKIEEGSKLIEGSSVVQDQFGIKGSCEVVKLASPTVGLDALNLQGTMDVKEMSDSTTNMEAGVKQIEGSEVVKNQIDIAVTEPPSPRVGLEVTNMQGTRDDNESLVSVRETEGEQIEGIGVVELQAPVSECELPSLTLGSDVQFGHLDSMSSFKDNQEEIDGQQQRKSYLVTQEEMWGKVHLQHPLNIVSVEEALKNQLQFPTEKTGLESKIEFEPLQGSSTDIATSLAYVQSRQHDDAPEPDYMHSTQSSQHVSELKSDDGFNWRKYGQKPVKGSKYQRSYYRCTYPNCPTKKKVERSLTGEITEIVYKGSHNHPKPKFTRRSTSQPIQASSDGLSDQLVPKISNPKVESVTTPDDLEQNSPINNSGGVEDENEPVAEEWDVGNTNDHTIHTFSASGSSIVKEPRTVVQVISQIDLVDDGYRWRKFGHKVMKGNSNPRSYYKCTSAGCPVRKRVERSLHDLRSVITTYEGKHNHGAPAARYSDIYSAKKNPASEHQSRLVGLDVLDVHATEDTIKETLVAAREIEQEVKLNEGSGVVQNQIEIGSSREVAV